MMLAEPVDPKSVSADIDAETSENGVQCDKCHGTKTEVKRTTKGWMCVRRERVCSTCGHLTRTRESSVRLFRELLG